MSISKEQVAEAIAYLIQDTLMAKGDDLSLNRADPDDMVRIEFVRSRGNDISLRLGNGDDNDELFLIRVVEKATHYLTTPPDA